MKQLLVLALSILTMWGCAGDDFFGIQIDQENVQGFKPVYIEANVSKVISKQPARDIANGGVIFSYGDLLLVNERGQGIHVINNADPANPVFQYFISIPGNYDMSFKDDLLYVDNFNDLVTIRLTVDDIEVVNRVANVIEFDNFPPQRGVHFECVDATKGNIIGWEITNLQSPKCYR